MKLISKFIAIVILVTSALSIKASAAEYTLNLHLFYSDSCPHCAHEKVFLSEMENKYPNIKVNMYEITKSKENLELFRAVGELSNLNKGEVPLLVIGDEFILGYSEDLGSKEVIEQSILDSLEQKPTDAVGSIINTGDTTEVPINQNAQKHFEINVPLLGKINSEDVSLPSFTFILALLDGFNPCAMWVLLFLISLLLGMEDRKKMWILGTTFILASGLVYLLFLAAWLNFFLFIGYAPIVRVLIGLLAGGIGIYYLRNYFRNKDGGCDVMENEKRLKTFEKIRNVTKNKNILIAMLGMIILAFAVNMVELLCSAGLPAVFTNVLSMAGLPTYQYYLYLLFYILIFMLDDLVVFIIAMVTLRAVGVESKYARYSHLVGGVLMFLIGLTLLFKPELLMFG